MTELKNYAMTHGGKFHADDVFSAALLKTIKPDIKIIRAFEIPKDFDGIIFDIGYGKFDHHQKDAQLRENGAPYAAFGLLWREYGEKIIGDAGYPLEQAAKEATRFDESFVQPLDEDDNTGCGNQLADVIDTFNPSWDSEKSSDQCFAEAVDFAIIILKKKIDSVVNMQRANGLVEAALAESKDNIVVLPRFAPWKMVLAPSDAEFVIYPSQRGGYSAQVIPIDLGKKESKYYFPKEWSGKEEDELQKVSGIGTLTFCHNGRFLISAGSLEDIVKACKLARENADKV